MASQSVIYHADEIWQYLEPAYGVATGRWVETWDYVAGIRGWFLPVALSLPVRAGLWLSADGQAHVYAVRATLAFASLGVVWAFHDLARPFGRLHAWLALWVAAVWPDILFFAVRSSGEAIAISLILPGLAWGARARASGAWRQALLAGLLLGLGAVARFQFVPALLVFGIWMAWPWRAHVRLPLIVGAGALAGLALGGLGDVLMGRPPLGWIVQNVTINLVQGRANHYGVEPPLWLVEQMLRAWSHAAWVIVPLMLIGMRRRPELMAMVVVVVAQHALIAHKELRFVLLASVLSLLLAALGAADAAQMLGRWRARQAHMRADGPMPAAALPSVDAPTPRLLAALMAGLFALSVTMAVGDGFVENWGLGGTNIATQVAAGQQPGLCGLAAYAMPDHPALAHALIQRPVPLLLFDGPQAPAQMAADRARFNVVLAARGDAGALPAGFALVTCPRQMHKPLADQGLCIFARPGPCHGGAGPHEYVAQMRRMGY
ncbi:mannosyltransferase [Novosphingobium sp. FSY-8]|uniref:Mannosyltransferase n=2 Tax=Novosphingobium ovatum TaxID=1908523 RepID=A0ABW9X9S6_9SPHN|nr:mannosyltransferase [Novosphingobium ovatum]